MKRFETRLLFAVLTAVLCAGMVSPAATAAATTPSEVEIAAAYLQETGILVGDGAGNMNLDRTLNRVELATMLARITGNPDHIDADQAFYSGQCTFTDVPVWAQRFVGYCETNHLLFGYGDGTYGSYDPVTPAAACTVMLRCLADIGEDWSYDTACQKAASLGIFPTTASTTETLTRGNMAVLTYRTMARMGFHTESENGTSDTRSYNADGSINLPQGDVKLALTTGDVIRCDDGTNYKITDTSHNREDPGPLPTATCDWSQFPALELPKAEARHLQMGGTDYLFVRNLYETRRMQYTLYNAIGSNEQTWKNGKLVLRSDGSPLARVQLTIPQGTNYQSFWPWRAELLTNDFESCPPGLYQLESWDVYANGVFLYTEYMVAVQ